MENKKQPAKTNPVLLLGAAIVGLVAVNLLFISLTGSEARSINLLKKEVVSLRQQEKIVAQAQTISDQYASEIEQISSVFPNEENIPLFIQQLEEQLRGLTDEYSFKFNSVTPVPEGQRLYIPLTINMKTDLARFGSFLDYLEKTKFMTHVTLIQSRVADGFSATGTVSISLKVYVQNPFTGS